ncbi:MAG: diguanylate cyclase [Betaproteobacteria bacterium]|nr:diguanylate cyclase [Betaproteobacteria bacterium]
MPAIPEAPARDETAQPAAPQDLRVLDLLPGPACDDIALLAAQICAAPISLVVLTGGERTRVKARVGLDADQADRALAFVGNAGAADAAFFVVEEAAQDPRFHADPLVTGAPHIRFCAGARLATAGGQVLGTVCVFDTESRAVSATQQRALQALARQTTALLEARLGALAAEQAAVDSQRQIELLVRARRLGACVRATDLVGRLAGDEFVLVLEGIDGVLELGRLADKIVACVRPRIEVEGAALAVTVSLGVAIYRGAEQSAADVLALADAALHQAKQQGRNRFSLA